MTDTTIHLLNDPIPVHVNSVRDEYVEDQDGVTFTTGVRATPQGVIPVRRTIRWERIDYIEKARAKS